MITMTFSYYYNGETEIEVDPNSLSHNLNSSRRKFHQDDYNQNQARHNSMSVSIFFRINMAINIIEDSNLAILHFAVVTLV